MKQQLKIVIAPDSFKGSMTASKAADAIEKGLRRGFGTQMCVEVIKLPIADGGEGTLDALVPPAHRIRLSVTGPQKAPVSAQYGRIGKTAVIEMASAAGLTLVKPEERNVLTATTYGVGELILHALNAGFRSFLLTVGGSGTNDGGCGMIAALGARFFRADGSGFVPTGGSLAEIARIDFSHVDARLRDCSVVIATDVRNPLLGETGATYVYAPQKGADETSVLHMEAGMRHYAQLLSDICGKQIGEIPGCGAGGGLSTPLLALTSAEIRSGIQAVLEAVRFTDHLDHTDLIITGEGRLDCQSMYGKTVSGVLKEATQRGIPVYCFAGCLGDSKQNFISMGLAGIETLAERAADPEDSVRRAEELLEQTAEQFASGYCGKH